MSAIQAVSEIPTNGKTVLVDTWLILFCMTTYILTGCKTEFVSNVFAVVTVRLKIKNLMTITIHHKYNCKIEHFNQTLAAHLQHYIAERKSYPGQSEQLRAHDYSAETN